ncbi:MAG: DUF2797 domain-containing protein [Acidobacteriota bacterium]|nr:DUF2797 domain-containing protein [Acidobacteriota bacterium]
MTWRGYLKKMAVRHTEPVEYELRGALAEDDAPVAISSWLGRRLRIETTGDVRCIYCGGKTRKPYGEGSCFRCFRKLPQNDICIVKPELCHFHQADNPCRDPAWGREHCLIDHVLYLAVSAGVKVGITRHTQVPTRWIDQGAAAAMPLARLPDRLEVGRLEKILARSISDRTHWQAMLRGDEAGVDLEAEAERLIGRIPEAYRRYLLAERPIYRFTYPALRWPEKVRSINLLKTPSIEGRLEAIRGQYLLFDEGVLNVRRHSGVGVVMHTDG